jgi:dipeptidyl aminopeptidase/acylaminoacyl peptidase
MRRSTLVLGLALLAAPEVGRGAAKRNVEVGDLFRIKAVGAPQISADGKWVAYTVTTKDEDKDKSETRVWMAPVDGGDPLPMSVAGKNASEPRFSPDGKYVSFLAARGEDGDDDDAKTQVWLLDRRGGEAQQLTEVMQGVDGYEWSPDGKRLVLLVQDPTPQELEAQHHKEAGTKPARPKADPPAVIDRIQFKRDDSGYLDRRRTHLYVFDVAEKKLSQVTSGDYDDAQPAWSPDGRFLAFSSNRTAEPDSSYDSNLWLVASDSPDKGKTLVQVTTNPGSDDQPAWSPDGKWIAYVSSVQPELLWYSTQHLALIAAPTAGGRAAEPSSSPSRSTATPRAPSSRPTAGSIYFLLEDSGTTHVAKIPVGGGTVSHPVGGARSVGAFTTSKDGTIAAQVSEPMLPNEVFVVKNGGTPRQLTTTNKKWLDEVRLSDVEDVEATSPDGTKVEAFVVKPAGFTPVMKYPALLRIHGGPTSEYEAAFNFEAQLFAANGYVVVLPNPRGSTGYGQDFCRAIFADWGNKDEQDVIAALDHTIAQGLRRPRPHRRRRLVVRRDPHRLRHQQDDALQGAISGAGGGPLAELLRPRPLSTRVGGGARPALAAPRRVGTPLLAVLQRREDHDADPLYGRRHRLERSGRRLGEHVSGDAAVGEADAARRLPGRASWNPPAELPEGPTRAVPRLVREVREGRECTAPAS